MSLSSTEVQDSGAREGAGILESRLTGLGREEFARDVWGRTASLTRGASDFSDVFSPSAVDELISRRGLRTPFLRVAKDGATLPSSSFTAPAGVGATVTDQLDDTALWRAFADGATLVLQALHRTWEPVADLVSGLSTELGHPVQANAYVTPPQNRGFDAHYDVHDVFVLQIEGAKRWVIHEPVLPDPLRDQPWTDHRAAVADRAAHGTPHLDTMLRPGDVLYLPRGWLHSAQAQGEVSIHLTLGVHAWTRYALAEHLTRAALAALGEDPSMRRSLPLAGPEGPGGADGTDGVLDLVRERLLAAVAEADPAPLFHRARRSQARPAPLGPVAQLTALSGLATTSPVRLRKALEPRLEGTRLFTRVGYLDFPEADLLPVARLLDGRVRTAGDLGLALAGRLLRAGVLVPADR
ncbi:cupin-like domain-containing protein [Streptomyces sp. MBT56]|uniref:cupin domain-containing protein n=1 Tax=unclassified Streptomyces TaxID=2593676 RepID=UPI001909A84B|nr:MULTISPECIES: cupin domain-containing protein [unclassified Streptomyces]MBK3559956.1 cupin-like domain-containing protein [Streptomyces sp. MBT56]MBK3600488.1 cupin-like domain-containing protein [Streptomyces sp. MBT54]MBK3617451.1 cupin-like domain-containing protein [Streptomyces sp. MBT98]MBK6044851.1 cupin-like domain-containing protein [Streptomyces sp. MBT55]